MRKTLMGLVGVGVILNSPAFSYPAPKPPENGTVTGSLGQDFYAGGANVMQTRKDGVHIPNMSLSGGVISNTQIASGNYILGVPVTGDNTLTVCASGCQYSSPADAWDAAAKMVRYTSGTITISISDGVYDIPRSLFTEDADMGRVAVIGDTANPAGVILNFTATKGTNSAGFEAYDGGHIGMIDGMTISTPVDGTGALASTDSQGRHIWNNQSYGAGIAAYGGGIVQLGSHLQVDNFYYGLDADNNGVIDAPNGGVTVNISGDVNMMARGGGVIVCTPCTANGASDYTDPAVAILGSNFDAERGGSLLIDGSTGKWTLEAGLLGLTGGHIWAHNLKLTGASNNGDGVMIASNSTAELTGTTISGGYTNGIVVSGSSFALLTQMNISGNTGDGVQVDGGYATGSSVSVTNNGGFGYNIFHTGSGVFFDSFARATGNTGGVASVDAGGTLNGFNFAPASLNIQ